MGHEALSGHTCNLPSFHSTIIDDFDSDHRGVTFDFTLPGSVLRARPPWRFIKQKHHANAIDIDLHTGGGPIWPSHRLWRNKPRATCVQRVVSTK